MSQYKTCKHIHDTGYFCQSAAVTGRDYCCYHLRHRGRLMRMAQYRTRGERFDLRLPPLENMHAVQSALSELMEALAADMIDPKRAHEIHSILRSAATNFRHPNAWQASAYANDQSQPFPSSYEEFEAEFGLPEGIDIDAPPEVAFPPPDNLPQPGNLSPGVILSEERSDESKDPFVSAYGMGAPPLSPAVGDKVGDNFTDNLDIRPDFPVTPEMVEIVEVSQTYGSDAAAIRAGQLQRNRQRRELARNHKRYAQIALQHNLKRAAEKIAAEKLAAEKAAAQKSSRAGAPA